MKMIEIRRLRRRLQAARERSQLGRGHSATVEPLAARTSSNRALHLTLPRSDGRAFREQILLATFGGFGD